MKKSVQLSINEMVHNEYDSMMDYICKREPEKSMRLRSCNATVYYVGKYIILISYKTIVAFINTEIDANRVYDVLRLCYGYTSTSAQHIAKFKHDFASIPTWNHSYVYTWKEV